MFAPEDHEAHNQQLLNIVKAIGTVIRLACTLLLLVPFVLVFLFLFYFVWTL